MNHSSTSLPSNVDSSGMDDSSWSVMFNTNEMADLEAQLNSIILGERPSTPETETTGPVSSTFGGSDASGMEERSSRVSVAAAAAATEKRATDNKVHTKDKDRNIKRKARASATTRKKSSRSQFDKDGVIKREAGDLASIGTARKPRTKPALIRISSAASRNNQEEDDEVVKRQRKAMIGTPPYRNKAGATNDKKGGRSSLFDPDPRYSEDHLFGNMQGALPVATFVIEEDVSAGTFDGELPRAEAIKPEQKTRYNKCCISSALPVTLLIVVGVVSCVMALVALPSTTKDDDTAATMGDGFNLTVAPTTYRESLGIQKQLEIVFGAEKFADETKAHSTALAWLLHDDPMQLPPDAKHLMQRYVLALFYFQTTTRGPWRSCNPPVIGSNDTRECGLQLLKWSWPELEFDTVPSNRWLGKTHECEWAGITCVDDSVQYLILGKCESCFILY